MFGNIEVSLLRPILVTDVSIMLNVCGWHVPAGFPSPAADHAQERIDLNKQLIRNKEATYIFRVKGDSMIVVWGVVTFNLHKLC
jgi:DNA polymerase V